MTYWSWPIGAAALSGVAIGYWLFTKKTLGVSGLMEKVVGWEKDSGVITPGAALAFLVMMVGGGVAGSFLRGAQGLSLEPAAAHLALFGSPSLSLAVMGLGGVLVGYGVRLASGCTSGHGLSGCSRLQPRSLAATASFFGTAILTSFLLKGVLQ